jgi:GntR family transcriptional regulator/MocR family aminotransferase
MTTFIDEGHLQRHLRRARHVYRQRHHRLWAELTGTLARHGRPLPSDAGLHLTLLLTEQITDDELRTATRASGIAVASLRGSHRFTTPRSGLIIGFGALPTDDIPAARHVLSNALGLRTL